MTGAALVASPAQVSSLGRRFAGWLVDGLVAAVAAVPMVVGSMTATDDALRAALLGLGVLLVVVVAVGQWVAHGLLGWTVGRRLLGMRTVDVDTLRPIGMGRVLLRGLVVAAGALVLGIGQLVVLASPLFDRTGRNRGWHDRAAGDEVVDLRPAGPELSQHWFEDVPGDVRSEVPAASVGASAGAVRVGVAPARVVTVGSVPGRVASTRVSTAGSGWGPPDGSDGDTTVPAWASAPDAVGAPVVTGSTPLVLAPLAPREHGPDVDTRAIPMVRPVPRSAPGTSAPSGPVAPERLVVGTPTAPAAPAAPDVSTASVGLDPELEMTRRTAPRPEPEAEPEPSHVAPDTAELALSEGRRVVVAGVALVGRNPAAAVDVQIVRVVDPTRSVSKTHLQVTVTHTGVWVADRGSTNGTVVTLPDGAQVVCPVDHPVRLRAGSTVTFGDSSFVVVRGPRARD